MKSFKVAEGAYVSDGVEHPVGDVIELDESTQEVQDAVAAGVLLAVEAPAEDAGAQPGVATPRGHFSLQVKWREGTTEGEVEAAQSFIKEFTDAIAESEEDHFPLCMDSITVLRDR